MDYLQEEKLLGYLLKALPPEEMKVAETLLAQSTDAQHTLGLLRGALTPLASDLDDPEEALPANLVTNTIGAVAEYIVNSDKRVPLIEVFTPEETLPGEVPALFSSAPVYPALASESASEARPSRRNVITIAFSLVVVLGIGFPLLASLRAQARQTNCADSLRQVHVALTQYADDNDGAFPHVRDFERAETGIQTLREQGYMPQGRLSCNDKSHGLVLGNYSYTLGYRDDTGSLQGMNYHDPDQEYTPLLADAPKRKGDDTSPMNHRRGQNVLFASGQVRFCTHANVGIENDHIFRNEKSKVGAGLRREDAVLGRANELP